MEKKSIYPCSSIRINGFASLYSDIAMRGYCDAKKHFVIMAEKNFPYEEVGNYMEMYKNMVITCVFSAMAIEAFFNDYAAACLGDIEFYENFEKLSTISKFQFIAKFILQVEIDKGCGYYSNLKSLVRNRDAFIHNKSKESSFQGYTLEELLAIEDFCKDAVLIEDESRQEGIKLEFEIAKTSIRAMRDIAKFFDAIDSNVYAKFRLLGDSEMKRSYVVAVFKEFGI